MVLMVFSLGSHDICISLPRITAAGGVGFHLGGRLRRRVLRRGTWRNKVPGDEVVRV